MRNIKERLLPPTPDMSRWKDLRCPRCNAVVAANYFEQYHAAPWAMRQLAKPRCTCGYPFERPARVAHAHWPNMHLVSAMWRKPSHGVPNELTVVSRHKNRS